MVFVNDKKFACESCIKGHRSSGCQHTDRPLFEVKKKGRPVSQCDKCRELRKTKRMHGKCNCSSTSAEVEAKAAGPSDGSGAKPKSRRFKPIAPALPNGLKDVLPAPSLQTETSLNLCRCGGKDAAICTCGHERGPSMPSRRPDNGGLAALAQAALFCCGNDLPSTSASVSGMLSNPSDAEAPAAPTENASRKHTRSCCSSAANSRPPSPKPKRTKHSNTAPALTHSHDQHIPHAPDCCSSTFPPAYIPSLGHTHTSSSAPPLFPPIHPHTASAPVTANGCCCGVQCACPGCVQHRGTEHASKDYHDCEEGECQTCVDHDGGIALPERALAFSQGGYVSNQVSLALPPLLIGSSSSSSSSSGGRARGENYIDAFFATAASLPAPPPGRTGALDPTNVLVYPKGIFDDAEKRSLFGLVEVPKLQCNCPGGCGCPEGQCACGDGCTGCAPGHMEEVEEAENAGGTPLASRPEVTVRTSAKVRSCCSG